MLLKSQQSTKDSSILSLPSKTCQQNHTGCYKWSKECWEFHQLFTAANDMRGQEPAHLDLSGATPHNIMRKEAVLNNLKTDENWIKT